jgi:ABC-2 type transport system ATP-binding protein
MSSFLEILQLQFKYQQTLVLNIEQWALEMGQIHGLVGLNGAGKSTLFRLIASELPLQHGTVSWKGQPLNWRDVLHIPTEPSFYPGITGKDFLDLFPQERKGVKLEQWAELLHLPLHKPIEGYSTGMKKKLGLLSMMKSARHWLLLDEPFNGLDLEAGQVLGAWLKERASAGCGVLVAAHQLELLQGNCDLIHWLDQGQLRGSFLPEELPELSKKMLAETNGKVKALLQV